MKQSKNLPIISLSEARKLLGQDSYSLDDNQVIEIIETLHLLARKHLSSKAPRKR